MERRPRLVLIQGGESATVGPITRMGLRPPTAPAWVLWGAVVTKVVLLAAVIMAIRALR